MRLGPALQVAFAASSVLTSVAFDFGGQNDVSQTAATVAPDQDAGSLTPTPGVNGFGTIGVTVQLTPTSGESTGGQGWPQQGGGDTLGVDCSGSNAGGWTPPSGGWGGQGEGTLGVECSGSGEGDQGWGGGVGFGGGQGWGGGKGWGGGQGWGGDDSTLGVECSGSGEGAWTPPSGGQGWGPQISDCSQSSGFSMAGSSGGQGWGPQSSDCSQSSGFSMAGSSAVEGSQETAGSLPTGSAPTESSSAGSPTTESSSTSSAPTESSAGGSATTESSATGSATSEASTPASTSFLESDSATTTESALSTGDTEDQSSSTTASSSSTATGSSVGADADQGQTSKLRSTNTESSASSETTQQEQQQQQQDDSSVAYTDTSGSDAIAYTSVWGSPVVAETSSNHTSAVPTFGDVTSKTGECVTGNPTEYISTKYLDWVWEHRIGPNSDTSNESNWNVMANKNWIMDKLVHNNGSMNYCVRWDTDNQLTKDVASKFQDVLTRHYNAWNKWLEGYNCWPFTEININMVGWATKDASQFEWKDDSLGTIYEGVLDPTDGVPQCPNECYRFYDNVNNQWSDTSACKGEPYDISFWLKEDIPYGFGYDWGQEVSLNNTLQNLYDKNILFVGHEIGHGFGLPDFYDLTQKPSADFPRSIMMAYSSITITPSDGWMLRRVLDHVRSRYKF